ncbi:OLC1v1012055C1 [Oldenlandia corymbosa var. corymbosa]|uniref:OLC1v1012055C1 n=1 Tax=Oldenlandia corymbosa var. corymbosa TaxID=529605 RepID=A0AAV1DV74_OLDCO|nr:OLC1v1012055C1 [Oldenlandia corymbosa var. corymbosa]
MDSMTRKQIQNDWSPFEDTKVYPLSKKVVFSFACRIFLGMSDDDDDQALMNVDTLKRYFYLEESFMFSLPVDLPGTGYSKAMRAGKISKEGILKAIIGKIQQGHVDDDGEQSVGLLTHILFRSKTYNKGFIREKDVWNALTGVLLPAYDDITAAITFLLKYLAQLPHIYTQVYTVLNAAVYHIWIERNSRRFGGEVAIVGSRAEQIKIAVKTNILNSCES